MPSWFTRDVIRRKVRKDMEARQWKKKMFDIYRSDKKERNSKVRTQRQTSSLFRCQKTSQWTIQRKGTVAFSSDCNCSLILSSFLSPSAYRSEVCDSQTEHRRWLARSNRARHTTHSNPRLFFSRSYAAHRPHFHRSMTHFMNTFAWWFALPCFHFRLHNMFALFATVFLSLIVHGHGSMKATAVLYDNNSMNSRGTLTFSQADATAPVVISGTLSGLNVSSAHVSSPGRDVVFLSSLCSSRVSISMPLQCPREIRIVLRQAVISIPTVREKASFVERDETKMEFVLILDVNHGPITGSLLTRHVGDLGNLTTDASGSVSVTIQDYIIQLYNATQNIAGLTVVVHRMRDDGGTGGYADSNTTGFDSIPSHVHCPSRCLLFQKCWCASPLWSD